MEMNVNQSTNDMKSILPRRVDFVKLIEFTVVHSRSKFRRLCTNWSKFYKITSFWST